MQNVGNALGLPCDQVGSQWRDPIAVLLRLHVARGCTVGPCWNGQYALKKASNRREGQFEQMWRPSASGRRAHKAFLK